MSTRLEERRQAYLDPLVQKRALFLERNDAQELAIDCFRVHCLLNQAHAAGGLKHRQPLLGAEEEH